jgi:hypothetical protein
VLLFFVFVFTYVYFPAWREDAALEEGSGPVVGNDGLEEREVVEGGDLGAFLGAASGGVPREALVDDQEGVWVGVPGEVWVGDPEEVWVGVPGEALVDDRAGV